jgi:hypothetical protein
MIASLFTLEMWKATIGPKVAGDREIPPEAKVASVPSHPRRLQYLEVLDTGVFVVMSPHFEGAPVGQFGSSVKDLRGADSSILSYFSILPC